MLWTIAIIAWVGMAYLTARLWMKRIEKKPLREIDANMILWTFVSWPVGAVVLFCDGLADWQPFKKKERKE